MRVLGQLFLSSRPLSWVNMAFPFAAAYLMTTRTVDLTFIVGTLFFLIPYKLHVYFLILIDTIVVYEHYFMDFIWVISRNSSKCY